MDQIQPENVWTKSLKLIFNHVNQSFKPIIQLMAISTFMKGILSILVYTEILIPEKNFTDYQIYAAISNSIFYFMPILLGFCICKKMNLNPFVGALLGAALLEPNFTGLLNQSNQSFLTIPIIPADFGGSILPIFISTYIYYFIHNKLKNINFISENEISLISLAFIIPIIMVIFGEIGVTFGSIIAQTIQSQLNQYPVLFGALLGGSMIFIVVFGLHWGLLPLIIANINNGGDNIAPIWACATFAQIGIGLSYFVITKDDKRNAFYSISGSLFSGVIDAITYGVIIKNRRAIPIVMLAGSIGGALNGYFNIKLMDIGFHSILSITLFQPNNTYMVGIGVSLLIASGLSLTFRKKIFF